MSEKCSHTSTSLCCDVVLQKTPDYKCFWYNAVFGIYCSKFRVGNAAEFIIIVDVSNSQELFLVIAKMKETEKQGFHNTERLFLIMYN